MPLISCRRIRSFASLVGSVVSELVDLVWLSPEILAFMSPVHTGKPSAGIATTMSVSCYFRVIDSRGVRSGTNMRQ